MRKNKSIRLLAACIFGFSSQSAQAGPISVLSWLGACLAINYVTTSFVAENNVHTRDQLVAEFNPILPQSENRDVADASAPVPPNPDDIVKNILSQVQQDEIKKVEMNTASGWWNLGTFWGFTRLVKKVYAIIKYDNQSGTIISPGDFSETLGLINQGQQLQQAARHARNIDADKLKLHIETLFYEQIRSNNPDGKAKKPWDRLQQLRIAHKIKLKGSVNLLVKGINDQDPEESIAHKVAMQEYTERILDDDSDNIRYTCDGKVVGQYFAGTLTEHMLPRINVQRDQHGRAVLDSNKNPCVSYDCLHRESIQKSMWQSRWLNPFRALYRMAQGPNYDAEQAIAAELATQTEVYSHDNLTHAYRETQKDFNSHRQRLKDKHFHADIKAYGAPIHKKHAESIACGQSRAMRHALDRLA